MPNWAWMLIIVFVALAFFEDLRRGMAADREARLARHSQRVLALVGDDDRRRPITQEQLRVLVDDADHQRRPRDVDLVGDRVRDDAAQQLELARGERLEAGSRHLN